MNAMKMWSSAVLFVFAINCALFGQEREFPSYNCAITPPDGWQMLTNLPSQPGMVATFANAERTRLVFVLVDDHNKSPGPLDDRFVTGFEQGVERGGMGKRLWGKFIEVGGMKAYERLGNATIRQKQASVLVQCVPVEGRVYDLQGMRVDGDASEAPEIQKCLATFRFLTPATPPSASNSRRSAAYETGRLMGQIMVFVGVIVAVIVIARTGSRKKSTRNPTVPPPLPPLR